MAYLGCYSAGNTNSAGSKDVTVEAPAGTKWILFGFAYWDADDTIPSDVTVLGADSTPATLVSNHSTTGQGHFGVIYKAKVDMSGTHGITWSQEAYNTPVAVVALFYGKEMEIDDISTVYHDASGADINTTIAEGSEEVVGFGSAWYTLDPAPSGEGQTLLVNHNESNERMGACREVGETYVRMTGNYMSMTAFGLTAKAKSVAGVGTTRRKRR